MAFFITMELKFKQLPRKKLRLTAKQSRVLWFVPDIKITINHRERNPKIKMVELFPPIKNRCSCGCGIKLTGRRTRWATKECSDFAGDIHAILSGRLNTISFYLRKYYDWKCQRCNCEDTGHETSYGTVALIKVDHIIPVKQNGGGCWLNNYQLLCHTCHVLKTKEDNLKYKTATRK